MENLQRINVKLITPVTGEFAPESFLAILRDWSNATEEWLDIADYIHMIDGPGVILFGRKRLFSFDMIDGISGILYANRADLEGTLEDRFTATLQNAVEMSKNLAQDQRFPENLSTTIQEVEIVVNDRKQAPNTEQSHTTLEAIIQKSVTQVLGECSLSWISDPSKLFGYKVRLSSNLHLI